MTQFIDYTFGMLLALILYPLAVPDGPLPSPVAVRVDGDFFRWACEEPRDTELLHEIAVQSLLDFDFERTNVVAHAVLAFMLQSEDKDLAEFAWGDNGLPSYENPVVHVSLNRQGSLNFRGQDAALPEREPTRVPGDRPLTVAAAAPLRAKPNNLLH